MRIETQRVYTETHEEAQCLAVNVKLALLLGEVAHKGSKIAAIKILRFVESQAGRSIPTTIFAKRVVDEMAREWVAHVKEVLR